MSWVPRSVLLGFGAVLAVLLLGVGRWLRFGWHTVVAGFRDGWADTSAVEPERWVLPLLIFVGVAGALLLVWGSLSGERASVSTSVRFAGRLLCVVLVAIAVPSYWGTWASWTGHSWGGFYNVLVPLLLAVPLLGLYWLRPVPPLGLNWLQVRPPRR